MEYYQVILLLPLHVGEYLFLILQLNIKKIFFYCIDSEKEIEYVYLVKLCEQELNHV